MKHQRILLIVISFAFFLLAAFIRINPIIQGDTLFLFDQGRDLWDVKKIVYDRDFTLIGPFTGIKGVFNGAYHYYLLAIPILLTNGHPLSGSYFNALLNLLAVVGCFVFGKRMYGTMFGITLALFFAFARNAVGVTQFFWNPNWIPAFMVPFMYYFFKGVIEKRSRDLIIAGFIAGIVANVEVAFGIWLIPVMIIALFLFWPKSWFVKTPYLAFIAYGMHFIPHLIFDMRNDFLMTRAIIEFFQGKNQSLGVTIPFPDRFLTRVFEVRDATVFAMSNNDYVSYGLLLVIVGVFSRYLFVWYQKRLDKIAQEKIFDELKIMLFFILPIVVYYLCFLVYARTAWAWYWVGLQVPYYFLLAYVLKTLYTFSQTVKIVSIVIIMSWFLGTIPAYFGSNDFLDKEPGRYSHMIRVIDDIFKDAGNTNIGVYTYTPPIIDYAFSYVLWWRGRTEFGYPPYTNYEFRADMPHKDTVYLILEPPPESARWETDGWKKTKTPQGEEVWQRDYPGRLTLIKRIIPYVEKTL